MIQENQYFCARAYGNGIRHCFLYKEGSTLVMWVGCRSLDTAIDGSNLDCISMLCP